ncbi:MAG: amidohydrolase family protein [Planctomycetota bacterium]
MNARILCLATLMILWATLLPAQTAPREGIEERSPGVHALVGARLHLEPGRALDDGIVVLRDGIVEAVGRGIPIPADARVWSLDGRVITAGWIDLDLRVELPEQTAGNREGRHWNPRVHPERDIAEGLTLGDGLTRRHREAGFALALAAPAKGILAGSGALVSLDGEGNRRRVLAGRVAIVGSLEHGGFGDSAYPGSRMGAVALLRQTLLDADWYRQAWELYRRQLEPVLEGRLPLALRAADALELLTLRQVAREFRLPVWFLGSGEEYLWLNPIAEAPVPLVIPVAFPEAPRVSGAGGGSGATLRALELWARAPENPVRLERAGVPFALTPRGLKKVTDFRERVRRAVERGLSIEAALAAVTAVPARFLGLDGRLGSIEEGKVASLSVFDGEPFDEDTRVVEVWIDGERHPLEPRSAPDIRGIWDLTLGERAGEAHRMTREISGKRSRPRLKVTAGGERIRPVKLDIDGDEVGLTLAASLIGEEGFLRLGGSVAAEGKMKGSALLPGGARAPFEAERTEAHAPDPKAEERKQKKRRSMARLWAGSASETLPVPLGAHGRLEPPFAPGVILVRGGTIWTCGPDGVIEGGDLLIDGGRVRAVGRDLAVPRGAHVIDARGKHVTPGLIDPHSHTAIIGGVNEGTQAVTAEVRIGDVLRAHDINIYRQLAGGVTAAQLLHGSANPIGGQSAIIKLRWESPPEGLKVRDAPGMIKFALGENVKQSNWGERFTTRYPQTRMGVEQIIEDAFLATRQYLRELDDYRQSRGSGKVPIPRPDLELDALAEVLEGHRFIHCHSYRQDEILMLIRLGEALGFRVGTFQHVLEGYKVANEIAAHGAGASTFSDWWAYKFEVYDAIPYNGALMERAGVVTSFNSDSSELARRLNAEAAKAVKYGGVPPEVALTFVTLNPARQLHLDDRIGSLEQGKDADFVIWSGDPLSTYTICLETWIDGRRYFHREEDLALRKRDRQRRELLVHRLLAEKLGDEPEEKDKDEEIDEGKGGDR